MAHSHNHQILANYWDSAYAALDGPQPKSSNFVILLGFGVVPTYVVYIGRACLGGVAATSPSKMAHSQKHQIVADYWDSAWSAYLSRLSAWAVQQPPHHLLLSYGNFWGSLCSPG